MYDQRLNQLSAQIAQMTPAQRQKFALLHKDDPILVSLTKFVNDQDNAVRTGFAAAKAPAAVNAPKVVDQTIAQMGPAITPPMKATPQNAGVGALLPQAQQPGTDEPAPQTPPGFAAGGAVPRYDGGGKILSGAMGLPMLGPQDRLLYGYSPDDQGTNFYTAPPPAQAKSDPSTMNEVALEPAMHEQEPGWPQPAPPTVPGPAAQEPNAQQQAAQLLLQRLQGQGVPPIPQGAPRMPGGGGAPRAPGIAALSPTPQPFDVQGNFDQGMDAAQERTDPIVNEMKKAYSERINAREQDYADTKASQDAQGVLGLEREKRLKAREAKLDKSEEENKGAALLSAGLAMMAGTSPNAFANIGNGAQVGLKQYQEGKAKLDELRSRVDDAYWQLEAARHQEGRENAKELLQAKKAWNDVIADAHVDGVKFAMEAYGINAKQASEFMNAALKDANARLEASTRIDAAKIGAQATLGSASIHAGATMGAARMHSADSQYHTNMSALTALATKPDQMYKQGDTNYRFALQQATREASNNYELATNPAAKQAWIENRAQQIAGSMPSGMGQSGAPSSAGQANFKFNPQSGKIEPYQ